MIKTISVILAVLLLLILVSGVVGISILVTFFFSLLPESVQILTFLTLVGGFVFSFLFMFGGGVEIAESIERRIRSLLDKEEKL